MPLELRRRRGGRLLQDALHGVVGHVALGGLLDGLPQLAVLRRIGAAAVLDAAADLARQLHEQQRSGAVFGGLDVPNVGPFRVAGVQRPGAGVQVVPLLVRRLRLAAVVVNCEERRICICICIYFSFLFCISFFFSLSQYLFHSSHHHFFLFSFH